MKRDKVQVIAALAGCAPHRAKQLLSQYRTRRGLSVERISKRKPVKTITLPPTTGPMSDRHKRYLERRKFDADELETLWDLRGTGPIGPFKLRIIAPIYFGGNIVSFQGRDITGKSQLPYKACPMDLEVRHHKRCLYGIDKVKRDGVVIVEGITDVWRLGPGAVATFGLGYTRAQLKLLNGFARKYIMFDSEDVQAMKQAEVMAASLSGFDQLDGVVEILDIGKRDPAMLGQREAIKLMEELDVS